jgi:hypothetical protein
METFASLFTGDDLIDPQYLLNELKDLPAEDCPQGKKWFQGRTYSIHSNLGPDKLNKFKSFVMLLTPEVRIRCMCNAKEKFEQAKRLITSRQEGTNKNDRCRLMHIVHTPEGKVMLSNAFMPKSRQQLDDPSFKEPWQAIANLFNDYENYKFINLSIKHDVSTGKPFAPYVAQSGYDSIASRAFDLNPQSSERPVRDAEWCKRIYKELRTELSKIFSKYTRSGNQDAEDEEAEWCKFVDNHDSVYAYAWTIFDMEDFDRMGKVLPEDDQRDTGAIVFQSPKSRVYSSSIAAQNRKRQRDRAKVLTPTTFANKRNKHDSRVDTPTDLPGILHKALDDAGQQRALIFIAGSQDYPASVRAAALLKMQKMAGLLIENTNNFEDLPDDVIEFDEEEENANVDEEDFTLA